jgi:hypothetical protein
MRALWAEDPTTEFQDDAYHDNPSFSPSPDLEELLGRKKETFNLHDAKSAAWMTLATILPSAAFGAWFRTGTQRVFGAQEVFLYLKVAKGCGNCESQVPPGKSYSHNPFHQLDRTSTHFPGS